MGERASTSQQGHTRCSCSLPPARPPLVMIPVRWVQVRCPLPWLLNIPWLRTSPHATPPGYHAASIPFVPDLLRTSAHHRLAKQLRMYPLHPPFFGLPPHAGLSMAAAAAGMGVSRPLLCAASGAGAPVGCGHHMARLQAPRSSPQHTHGHACCYPAPVFGHQLHVHNDSSGTAAVPPAGSDGVAWALGAVCGYGLDAGAAAAGAPGQQHTCRNWMAMHACCIITTRHTVVCPILELVVLSCKCVVLLPMWVASCFAGRF